MMFASHYRRSAPIELPGNDVTDMELTYGQDDKYKESTFYPDTLPGELFDHILRFFSALPKSESWERHIPILRILEMYGLKGALGAFMRQRFDTICISETNGCVRESGNNSLEWTLGKGPMLWTDNLYIARALVLAGAGESLRKLVVCSGVYDFDGVDENDTEIIDDILQNCPNVTALCVDKDVPVWLSIFGHQLHVLECYVRNSVHISRYCHNLRELTIHFPREDTRSLTFWSKVGRNLESLTLTCHIPSYEMEHIQWFCQSLRRISIPVHGEDAKELYCKLLASYGDKLEWAMLINMDDSELARVAATCPKALFKVFFQSFEKLLRALSILRNQLEHIELCDPQYSKANALVSRSLLRRCFNLRHISVYAYKIENVEAIIASSLPKQTEITLNIICSEEHVQGIMGACVKGFRSVEKLMVGCRKFPYPVLRKFMEMDHGNRVWGCRLKVIR